MTHFSSKLFIFSTTNWLACSAVMIIKNPHARRPWSFQIHQYEKLLVCWKFFERFALSLIQRHDQWLEGYMDAMHKGVHTQIHREHTFGNWERTGLCMSNCVTLCKKLIYTYWIYVLPKIWDYIFSGNIFKWNSVCGTTVENILEMYWLKKCTEFLTL